MQAGEKVCKSHIEVQKFILYWEITIKCNEANKAIVDNNGK